MLEIIAYGRPAPQGSKRHVGKGVMVESSKAVKPWRDDVKAAAENATVHGKLDGIYPIDAPLIVRMVFTVPKPTSAPKRRRTWPCRTPDLSKLIRSTEDALTAAGVWRDDARVVEYERTAKVYPGEDPEALDAPGVRIVIRTFDLDKEANHDAAAGSPHRAQAPDPSTRAFLGEPVCDRPGCPCRTPAPTQPEQPPDLWLGDPKPGTVRLADLDLRDRHGQQAGRGDQL